MFRKKTKEVRDVVVLSHVKPISEKENVAFAKYIYELSNHHYFHYLIMVFREKVLNSVESNNDKVGVLSFIKLLRAEIEAVANAYLEYEKDLEDK